MKKKKVIKKLTGGRTVLLINASATLEAMQ
jgi:hypothetical protein